MRMGDAGQRTGFTLAEWRVVIAIMALLATMLQPAAAARAETPPLA